MVELVRFIVSQFAEKPEEIKITEEETGLNTVTMTIELAESDMGKVIGRQGKIAKALRTIVKAASVKDGKKYNIEIKEEGEIE